MRKIVLACVAALSTGLMVKRMEEEAKKQGYECTITAVPINEVKEAAKDADIVLAGPQVRFQLNQVKDSVSCPVESIDMAVYGIMDGATVLKRVKEVLGD